MQLKISYNFLFFFCSKEDILSDVYKIGRTKKNDNAVISLHTNKKSLNNVGTTSKISLQIIAVFNVVYTVSQK